MLEISLTDYLWKNGWINPCFPTIETHKVICAHWSHCSALEMIKTGSTFACDMYHFPESIVFAKQAGLRGIVCGPQTQWPFEKVEMSGSVEEN